MSRISEAFSVVVAVALLAALIIVPASTQTFLVWAQSAWDNDRGEAVLIGLAGMAALSLAGVFFWAIYKLLMRVSRERNGVEG
ncbi:MAG: hypothetical protein AAFX78_20440 [Cyanobacteria bacterium J06638_20]